MNELYYIGIKKAEVKKQLEILKEQHTDFFCPRINGLCNKRCVSLSGEIFIVDDTFEIPSGSETEKQIIELIDENGAEVMLYCAAVKCIDYSITGGY